MAKSRNTAERTPAEQAAKDAQQLLDIRQEMKDLAELEAEVIERLKAYCQESGEKEVGGLVKLVERLNPPKLVGADGKRLEALKNKLVTELPKMYIKESATLDLGLILASLDSDPALKAQLQVTGLQIVQESSASFKAV